MEGQARKRDKRKGFHMGYPNCGFWSAMRNGLSAPIEGGAAYPLSVVDCGPLTMPTGKLVACDPFVFLRKEDMPAVHLDPGTYPVCVTIADVSDAKDGSHPREAYATLLLDSAAEEVARRIITPAGNGTPCPPEAGPDGSYYGFPVDAGTACFADHGAVAALMPEGDWYETLFDNGTNSSWFARMDDPQHIRQGVANIMLPNARGGENILIFHSGWGDGFYPIIGGYDKHGRLIRVHIDFMVVFDETAL